MQRLEQKTIRDLVLPLWVGVSLIRRGLYTEDHACDFIAMMAVGLQICNITGNKRSRAVFVEAMRSLAEIKESGFTSDQELSDVVAGIIAFDNQLLRQPVNVIKKAMASAL